MRKWRRNSQESPRTPPASPPSPEPDISLPDPQEARDALAKARIDKRRTEEFGEEVREMLAFIRQAREENHLADGLIKMIKEGR